MKAELKQKWLEALRSGKYKQGQAVLRTSADRFCCLGVLCDIVDPSGWGDVRVVETSLGGRDLDIEARPYRHGELSSDISLPTSVRALACLEFPDINAVITMNDSGKDFLDIACHIEANVSAE
jgi:hypothetical protein